MIQTFLALIPIFALILFGYTLKHIKFPSLEFWEGAEKLVYYVFFPALLIYKLSTASVNIYEYIDFIFVSIISIFILFLSVIIFRKVIKGSGENFTSVIQGAIRFNSYVFLALTDLFFGSDGLVVAAVLISFAIPFLNLLCISSFAIFITDSKASLKSVFKSIIKNPLILGCLIGGLINSLNLYIPAPILDSLKILSSATLPLGLLCVGVGLEFKMSVYDAKDIIVSSIFKFVVYSLIVVALVSFIDLTKLEYQVLMLFSAMPTATSAYILAKQLGGNAKVMASIITFQTLASIISIAIVMEIVS